MGDMDDIVKDFLVESNENLDQLDRDLVTLEKDPTAREVLASIFRTIHTIKGTTGFLGFSRLESVAHVGENLLSSLRDGRLLLNAEITSALLAMVDAVRQMLVHIENTGQEGEGDYSSLIEELTRLQMGEKKKSPYPQGWPPKLPIASRQSPLRKWRRHLPILSRCLRPQEHHLLQPSRFHRRPTRPKQNKSREIPQRPHCL